MVYCIECGKKVKRINLRDLCKECGEKIDKEIEEENKKLKQREKELKNKIIKECKIDSKIREIEKILKRPCMIQIDVANANWGDFLFGRFARRKFKVKPLANSRVISKLKGEYKDIDYFCRKAKRNGFETVIWSGMEVSLLYKGERYDFLSHGIFKDHLSLSMANRFPGRPYYKVANVEFELWKGK